MYIEIPNAPGTSESRIKALQAAKPLLSNSGGPLSGPSGAKAKELIEVASYIETGHSYSDLHPSGKKRPKVINVTMVAPAGIDTDEIEHFLSHVKDGSLAEFVEDMMKESRKKDEDEHEPVHPDDRPRFI